MWWSLDVCQENDEQSYDEPAWKTNVMLDLQQVVKATQIKIDVPKARCQYYKV